MKNVNDNRRTEQLVAAFLAHGEHAMTARHGIIVSFVTRHYGDVSHQPFSSGPKGLYGYDGFSIIIRKAEKYLPKYIYKQLGRQADDAFHDFARIDWNNTYDMFIFWEQFFDQDEPEYYYHADEEGRLRKPSWDEDL